jgi:hypothetical protein
LETDASVDTDYTDSCAVERLAAQLAAMVRA